MPGLAKSRYSMVRDSDGKEIPEKGLELFDLVVNDGDIHPYTGGNIPPHWHLELELFLATEGIIDVGIGENVYRLYPGDACFINSSVLHSFTPMTSSPCCYRSFVFDSGIVSGAPGSIFDTMYVRPLIENGPSYFAFHQPKDAVFFSAFDRAFHACCQTEDGYEFEVRHAFSDILLYVKQQSKLHPSRTLSSSQEDRIKQMISWIDNHLTAEITLDSLASSANICPRECQRLFHRYLHYTPTEYIRKKRLFLAAEKIAMTDLPITEIALSYGFSSPSYFSKQFRSLFGTSPSNYRTSVENHQNIQEKRPKE